MIDHRKFAAWVGLGGPRPTDAEIVDYVRDYLDNREGEITEPDASAIRECAEALAERSAETASIRQQVARLREALAECADDLECEIEGRYHGTKDHPAMAPKYECDMDTVRRARAALADAPAQLKPHLSADEFNNLPKRVRDYIHWIETDCDPQGTLRENFRLREENTGLRQECQRLADAPADAVRSEGT